MITINKKGGSVETNIIELCGLSTDEKPTENIVNGSIFIEIDTDKQYVYNAENSQWILKETVVDLPTFSEMISSNNIIYYGDTLTETLNSIGDRLGRNYNLQTTDKSNIVNAINEVFQSVSDGKNVIADAITDKGVTTSATDTFETMANNIQLLSTSGSSSSEIELLFEEDLSTNTTSSEVPTLKYTKTASKNGKLVITTMRTLSDNNTNLVKPFVLKINDVLITPTKSYTILNNPSWGNLCYCVMWNDIPVNKDDVIELSVDTPTQRVNYVRHHYIFGILI